MAARLDAPEHAWLAAAADLIFARSGAPPNDDSSRLEHRVALILLDLQRRIEEATRHGARLPPPRLPLPPKPPRSGPTMAVAQAPGRIHGPYWRLGADGGFRRLRPAFASEAECSALRSAMTLGMLSAFSRGGQTTLAVVPALVERLHAATGDSAAYTTLHSVLERVRAAAAEDDHGARAAHDQPAQTCPVCGCDPQPSCTDAATHAPLHHRGALLVRLLPPADAAALAPACYALPSLQSYWEPHVDRHNVATYDVSAVLYLASQGEHFGGGAFAFHDADADAELAPTAGSLLTFSSGAENPHSAGRVEWGTRFALACWFTRDAAHGVELPPPAPPDATLRTSSPPPSPPPPPLPLWSTDRAIASAAECCLADNDPLREALLSSRAHGRPLVGTLQAEERSLAGGDGPAMWLERLPDAPAAPPPPEPVQISADLAGGMAACDGEQSPSQRESAGPRSEALWAAVAARQVAYEQARRVRAAGPAAAVSSDFDVFG